MYGLASFSGSYVLMQPEEAGTGFGLTGGINLPPDASVYSADIRMSDEPGLFFYWFEIRLEDGCYRWGFPDESAEGLTAETLKFSPPFLSDGSERIPGFQVTVHTEDFHTPDWMKGAVCYQIFPDRFNRGSQFSEAKALDLMRYPERIWHHDWNEEVDFAGKDPEGYEACDFFGGTLGGVIEKLACLAEAGVTALYLNPVFKGRSNHRYDTGDYLSVDPLLGTNDDLTELFRKAGEVGIHVILDGVFSHTGADSLYFNRYDRYDSVGAWQEKRDDTPSRYTSWYRFYDDKRTPRSSAGEGGHAGETAPYECWWNFPSLPNVNEDELTYREFICGDGGVLAQWLKAGCSGFRLDVSDELPDAFLRLLRRRVKKENPEACVIGEIWEEPTAKISYGHHRDFLFGRTHDAVMGYAFRADVVDFLKGNMDAKRLRRCFDRLCAITPLESLYSQMNLLGSHDTARIITKLAGAPQPASRLEQSKLTLTESQREKGELLVLAGVLLQIGFPGMMAVYYGDERGMEGYDDPFNRRTYPRDEKESVFTARMLSLMRLRSSTPVLRTGGFRIIEADDNSIAICRFLLGDGSDVFGRRVDGPREAVIRVRRDGNGAEGEVAFDGSPVFSF